MRPNPLQDALHFLTTPAPAPIWTVLLYWLLLVGSVVIAVLAWRADEEQRSLRSAGVWLCRLLLGTMWYAQTLWKVPPNYDGLMGWMKSMVDHAAVPLQSDLVRNLVLPNIKIFGPLVYGVEVFIAGTLMLGLLSRAGAVLGGLMAINLWLGLYSAPGEWPWTYVFLILLHVLFTIDPPGRSLGADALIWRRRPDFFRPR